MKLENFLAQVAKRLNMDTSIKVSIYAALAFSCIVLILSLFYLTQGYAVPSYVFILAVAIGAGLAVYLGMKKWLDKKHAAYFADQHFDLKNGIATALHLNESKGGEFDEMQEQWTDSKISDCNPSSIPFSFSKKLMGLAFLLTIAAGSVAFIPTSQSVLNQQAEEEATLDRSQEAIDKLKEAIEEMEKDLSKEELAEIDLDAIKKQVDELEATGDRKEAVRQFAKLEQKARNMSKELDQKKDEEALKKAIKNLKKSTSKDAKKLAKKLEKKQFKEAAKQMKSLAPKQMNKELSKKEQLRKAKEQIEKLRAVSKQLAASSKSNSQANGGDSSGGEGLEGAMAEMDKQAKSLESLLKKLDLDLQRESNVNFDSFNKNLSECEHCMNQVANKWMKMEARKSAKKRLDGL